MTGKLRPRTLNACPSLASCFSLFVCLLFALNAFGQVEQGNEHSVKKTNHIDGVSASPQGLIMGPNFKMNTEGDAADGARSPQADEAPFIVRYQHEMKGDFTMIGNNIVSVEDDVCIDGYWEREDGDWEYHCTDYQFFNPNDDYNYATGNGGINMAYIDIDADGTTFSSSMSELKDLGNCSKIVYAGLYWAAVYDDGQTDFQSVEFKVPGGGSYINVPADDIIIDRENTNNIEGSFYACYADVTSLVTAAANPYGEYYVANIKAFTGETSSLGSSGGWTLVIAYENPYMPSRYVSFYDGFQVINKGESTTDFGYAGFNTIPIGTVKARFGISALEGDFDIDGDQLKIKDTDGDYVPLATTYLNDEKNFFNSNITVNDQYVTTRNPASLNTLGYDIDMFSLNNNSNQLIGNNQTNVDFQLKTDGDTYAVFLNGFSVDIIAPKLQVEKKVLDINGDDITGQQVELGQEITYALTVRNVGNDDAINAYILDDLPINVGFTPGDFSYPAGTVTSVSYDAALHQIRFDLDSTRVGVGDTEFTIKFNVKVAEDCEQLRDACERQVNNLASSYYEGRINGLDVVDKSFNDVNSCGTGTAGSTNIIADLGTCDFIRTEYLCDQLTLTAGSGYETYTWTKGTDPTVLGTTQELSVSEVGTYYVVGTSSTCSDIKETVIVDYLFDIENPLLPQADNVEYCTIDGNPLVEIYLCGAGDFREITTGVANTTVIWQQLDESTCVTSTDDPKCPNTAVGCIWNTISTDANHNVNAAGEFRVIITDATNKCERTFYFNVFQNTLDPEAIVTQPMICTTLGTIAMTNVPSTGYEFSMDTTAVNPWQSSPIFTGITPEGNYTIYTRKVGGGAFECVFSDDVFLPLYETKVDTTLTPITCVGGTATLDVTVTDGVGDYQYELIGFAGQTTTSDPHFTITGITAGTYTLEVSSDGGAACPTSIDIVVDPAPEFSATATLTKPLSCKDGAIDVAMTMDPSISMSDLNFSLESDMTPYILESDLPFEITTDGTYTVYVSNKNGCIIHTNTITVDAYTPMSITTTGTPGACATDPGSIKVEITDGLPPYTYILDEGLSTQQTITGSVNTTETFTDVLEGAHTIKVTDAGNCEVNANVTLTNPAALTGDLAITTNYTCAQDATLTVQNVSGGTPTYTYTITGTTNSNTTGVFTVTDGNYTVTITDASGVCSFETNAVTVDQLNAPSALTFSATPVQCGAANQQADITVTVADGNPDFTFAYSTDNGTTWSTGVTQTGAAYTFNDMAAGTTYTFRVTDAKGCAIEKEFTLNAITPLSISGNVIKDVSCINGTDGEYQVDITNGSGNFSYEVFDASSASIKTGTVTSPATSFDITNLAAGTYTVEVTDTDTNCVDTLTFTIEEPTNALALTASVTEITCNDNAKITATATGGWGTYTYTLEDSSGAVVAGPQTTNEFSGITTAGTYTVRVVDLGGCEKTATVEVKTADKPTIALDSTTDLCVGTAGATIVTTVTPASGTYAYEINGHNDTDATPGDGIFEGLSPGTYTITVTDTGSGCSATIATDVTIEDPIAASANLKKALDCTTSPDAQIELSISGGYPDYSVQVYEGVNTVGAAITLTPADLPYTYGTNTAGSYTFEITDTEGCSFTTAAVVVDTAPSPKTTSVTHTDVTCNGADDGTITVDIDETSGVGPFQVSIDNGNTYIPATSPVTTFSGLADGTYNVMIKGVGECTSKAEEVIIGQPNALTAVLTKTTDYRCDNTGAVLHVEVTGGTAPYTYDIGTGASAPTPNTTYDFNDITDGAYTVTVTDANGCFVVSNKITVAPLNAPTGLSFGGTTVSCNSSNTSDVTVTVAGGNLNFTFEITAPAAATATQTGVTTQEATFNDLAAGVTYTFKVTDGKGCSITDTYTVNPVTPLSATGSVTKVVSCFNDTDGSIHVEIVDGSGDYSYEVGSDPSVDLSTGTTVFDLAGLAAGTYSIVVTDDTTGCTDTLSIKVDGPAKALTLALSITSPLKCVGTGSIKATASDGWGTYQYTLTMPDGTTVGPQTSGDFTGLTQTGDYDVTVTDLNGCTLAETINMTAATAPTISVDASSDLCVGAAGATIVTTVNPTAGTYAYEINGHADTDATPGDGTFEGLSPGTYTITVTDTDSGCSATIATDVTIEDPIAASANLKKALDCTASSDAQIELSISGGYPDYSVQVYDGGSPVGSPIALTPTDLPYTYTTSNAGNYTFQITDSEGCTFTTTTPVSVVPKPTPTFTATATDAKCNGAANGSIVVDIDETSGVGPFQVSIDNGANFTLATTPVTTFSGLAQGDYDVVIKGVGECTATQTITVGEPNALTAVLTKTTDYRCDNTGAVLHVEVTGGTSPYTYDIGTGASAPTTNTSYDFNDITDGNYTVTVTDVNGCTITTASVIVAPLNAPTSLSFTKTAVTCPALTSDVTVTVTGGNAPFTYEITSPTAVNNGNNPTFTGLAPGTYDFLVTDDKGCTVTGTYTVNAISQLSVTGNATSDVTCFGGNDGSLQFIISGGSGNYSYTVNGGAATTTTNTSIDLTGLMAGTYAIVVTDVNLKCTDNVSITIAGPTASLDLTNLTSTPIKCATAGSITATVTGGWGSYQYTLEDNSGTVIAGPQNTDTFGGITLAGTYTVVVTDLGGCTDSQSITLTAPSTPTLAIDATTDLCAGGAGATIVATANNGISPYTYVLSGAASQTNTTGTFSGLAAGTYTVTVTDAYGCAASGGISLTINDPLTANASLTKTMDCSASPAASIELTISEGYPNYTVDVLLNGTSTGSAITMTPADIPYTYTTTTAGDYTFVVTDAEGCVVNLSTPITVAPAPAPSFTYTVNEPKCNGASNGEIVVTIDLTSGAAPFEISTDGGTTFVPATGATTTIGGLSAGTYAVVIRGDGQCTATQSVTIGEPTKLTASINKTQAYTCTTGSAEIEVIVSGGTGTGTYTYDIGNGSQTSNIFTGLTAGNYTVTIIDANGCSTTANVTIEDLNAPTSLAFAATAVSCTSGLTSDITVTVTGGNTPFTYEMDGVADPNNDGLFENVAVGMHNFTVTDAKGCSVTDSHNVDAISQISLTGDVLTNATCVGDADGSIHVDIAGGSGNYAYTIEDGAGAVIAGPTAITVTTIDETGLSADTYTVYVTDDGLGCTANIALTVKEPTAVLALGLTSTPIKCATPGTITATGTGGWGDYDYTLTTPLGNVVNNTDHPGVFTGLTEVGTYTVVVTDMGGTGCTATATIDLVAPTPPKLALDATNTDFCAPSSSDLATIYTTVTGGVAPYTYTIDGAPDTDATPNDGIFEDLGPGDYTITVTDAYGCSVAASTQTISINASVSASAQITKLLDCSATADADITVEIFDGYAPYSVEVFYNTASTGTTMNFPTANAPQVYQAANAGDYYFVVTDDKGCSFTTPTVTVLPKTVPDITAVSPANPILCHGSMTGAFKITLDPALGTSPFTVEVSNDGGATWTSHGTQTTITGLAADTYKIRVTGQGGCFDTAKIKITEPADLTLTTAATNISCSGAGTVPGSITATAGGGTGPYTYHLISVTNTYTAPDQTLAGSANFANLPYGIYQIQVSDANGCSIMKQDKVVSPPNSLEITIVSSGNCATGATMKVKAGSPISGAGNYYFAVYQPGMALPPTGTPPSPPTWIPETASNSETAIFTGMTPGITYTFVVYDLATGCYYIEKDDQMVPTASTLAVTSITPNPVACTTDTYGSVDFTIDNYNGDVQYSIYPESVTPPATPMVTGTITAGAPHTETNVGAGVLTPGSYYILFEMTSGANAGCAVASTSFTIEKSATPLTIATVNTTNDNCKTDAGTISVTAQGGTAPYEYSIDGTTWQTGNTFNVETGPYTVYVRDAYGCSISQTGVNVGLDTVAAFNLSVTNQCTAKNGEFIIHVDWVSGGVSPYTYTVNGGVPRRVPSDPFDITGLVAGTYVIGYQGVNGCLQTQTIEVYAPLTAQLEVTTGVTCTPGNDGVLTATVNGGSGDITYTITGQNTGYTATQVNNPVFTGLPADTYDLSVTDNIRTCTATASIELIPPVKPVVLSTNTNPVSCNGGSDGSLTVVMQATSLPDPDYEYVIYDDLGNPVPGHTAAQINDGTFTGLKAGVYFVRVTSQVTGCFEDSPILTIGEPTALSIDATVSPFTCTTGNQPVVAQITLSGNGGTPGYTYSTDGVHFYSGNVFEMPFTSSAQNITYWVKDANGCTDSEVITVPEAIPLLDFTAATMTDITCAGPEEIELTVEGGSGNYTFTELSASVSPQTVTGTTPPTTVTFNLPTPGTYEFQVVDDVTGCSMSLSYVVDEYKFAEVNITGSTDVTCNGASDGSLSFEITGYTGAFGYSVYDNTGVIVNSGTGTAPGTFTTTTTLSAGTYYVEVSETATPFCKPISEKVSIHEPDALSVTLANVQNANCNSDALISLDVTGGSGTYTYAVVETGDPAPSVGDYTSVHPVAIPFTGPTAYTVYVMDSNGCTQNVNVTIAEDPAPLISVTLLDQCSPTNGTFSIEIDRTQDGVGPYRYSLNGTTYIDVTTDPMTISGLNAAGSPYTIYYKDVNGCETTDIVSIAPELEVTAAPGQMPSCDPGIDGEITATVTGGSGTYTYDLSLGGTTVSTTAPPYTGLAPGTYTLEVTDTGISCTVSTMVELLTPTTPIVDNVTHTNATCAGSSTGSISVTMDVASLTDYDYTYVLYDATTATAVTGYLAQTNDGHFTGIPAGTYFVRITSALGCYVDTVDITITELPKLTISATETDFGCSVGTNTPGVSKVTITGGGGSGNHEYSIDGLNYFSGNVFEVAFGETGSYSLTVYVRDEKNISCTVNTTLTIEQAIPLEKVEVSLDAPIDCNGGEEVTVTVTGGSGNFDITLLPGGTMVPTTGANTATFTLPTAGTYAFQVLDRTTGCTLNSPAYVVDEFDKAIVTITDHTDVTCYGGNDGSLTFEVVGYVGNFGYSIIDATGFNAYTSGTGALITSDTDPTTPTVVVYGDDPGENIEAGVWHIELDETSYPFCDPFSGTETIDQPSEVQFTYDLVNANCNTGAIVTINARGGTPGYTYAVIPTTSTITGSDYGTDNKIEVNAASYPAAYTIYVKDSHGCPVFTNITLNQDPEVAFTATVVDPCVANGSFEIVLERTANGVSPYEYSVNGSAFLRITSDPFTLSGLDAGTYNIAYRSANGCVSTVPTITIHEPMTLTLSLEQQVSCDPGNDGSFSFVLNGGSGTYTYELFESGVSQGTYTASPITGLAAGDYSLRVTDTNTGCFVEESIPLQAPESPEIIGVTPEDALCFGSATGTITVNMKTSTMNDAPYIYVLNNVSGTITKTQTNNNVFTDLPADTYTVKVTSALGCSDTQGSIVVGEPTELIISAAATAFSCSSGNTAGLSTVTITVEDATSGNPSGTGPYKYSIDGVNWFSTNTITVPFKTIANTFDVYVKDDNGCPATVSVTVPAANPLETVVVAEVSPLTCVNDEQVEVTITGGSGTYDVSVISTVPVTAQTNVASPVSFTLPAVGTYTFVVEDANTGCILSSAPYTVDAVVEGEVNITNHADVSCNAGSNGKLTFELTDYAGNYTYEIIDDAGNSVSGPTNVIPPLSPVTVTGLPAGVYHVEVVEAAAPECTISSGSVTITEPQAISVAYTMVNANCDTDAIVTISASGGTSPYSYVISQSPIEPTTGYSNTNPISVAYDNSGIPTANNYIIYVKDGAGCIQSTAITIAQDPVAAISLSVTNQCTAANGSFSIEVDRTAPGVSPYEYSINGSAYLPVTSNPQIINDLSAGLQTVNYRSANGCVVTESITINEPLTMLANVTKQVTCAPTGSGGEITVTATGGDGSYTYTLTPATAPSTPVTSTTGVFTGLSPDSYTVEVKDGTVCTQSQPVVLNAPVSPVINVIFEDALCYGSSTGTLTIEVDPATDTNPPYKYEVVNTATSTTYTQTNDNVFDALPAGTYTVEVTSALGCNATAGTFTIGEPTQLVVSATATGYTCSTGNTPNASTVTISALDGSGNQTGTAPYTYSIDGVNWFTDDTFTVPFETAAQPLTVYVKDANGCETSASVTVDAAQTITAVNLTPKQKLSCAQDEIVEVSVTGGSGDYTVTLLGTTPPVTQNITAPATTTDFTLTATGTYTFQVTDIATGCVLNSAPYEVEAFNTATVDITAQADATCVGLSNGSLSFVVNGYAGNFAYVLILNGTPTSINGAGTASATMTPVQVTNLGEGVYSVQITETDYPECTVSSTNVTIKEPTQALSVDAKIDAPLTCAGNDAIIKAYAYGGNGNYQYQLEDTATGTVLAAYQSSPEFTGLSAGSYTVRVKSGTGVAVCDATDTEIISAIPAIGVTATAISNATCYGQYDGEITAAGSGGGGNYLFVLNYPSGVKSAPQADTRFEHLPAGTYTVTVTDNLGCSATSGPVTITEPAEVLANAVITTAQTCQTQAVITVTGSQGTAPYTYSTDGINFGNTNTFTVGPGAYTFWVKDFNGCTSSASTQITVPTIQPLTISLDDQYAVVSCHDGANASIFVQASGALGDYEYTLYNATDLTTPLQGPKTDNYFNGIAAGDYVVEVTSGDCAAETKTFSVANPSEIVAIPDVNQISCSGEADGSIEINATGGTGQIIYSLDGLQWFTDDDEFVNMGPGTYTLYVQDAAGCSPTGSPFTIDIIDPDPLTATGSIISQSPCSWQNGRAYVTVDVVGGTAPYTVSMTGEAGSYVQISGNSETFEIIGNGQTFNFFIIDDHGCKFTTPSLTMSVPINLGASYHVDSTCDNVHTLYVEVSDTVSAEKASYSLDNGSFQSMGVFTNVPAGTHEVTIIHPRGCTKIIKHIVIRDVEPLKILSVEEGEMNEYTVTAQGGNDLEYQMNNGPKTFDNIFEITESGFYTFTVSGEGGCIAQAKIYLEYSDVFIPNYFTPNNDGTNDYWMPENMPDDARAFIFDRYGRKIAEFDGTQLGWDGIYQGHELPSGDYWYWVKFNDGTDRQAKGHFTLIR